MSAFCDKLRAVGMPEGLYQELVTSQLRQSLQSTDLSQRLGELGEADSVERLVAHVAAQLRARLLAASGDERRGIANGILRGLGAESSVLEERLEELLALYSETEAWRYDQRPSVPLTDAALLTNSTGEPNLGTELRTELQSADRVDLLCAFIKWYGVRTLEAPLQALRDRRGPLRVLTTTYMGATDRKAVDELVRRYGAQVRISYEVNATRLHAKAWYLHRNSGFHTAFVGSSNLSRAALLEGLEWNVRLSSVATPALLDKFQATFDTYWNSADFEEYDPDRDGDRLSDALLQAGGGGARNSQTFTLSGLEVRPLPHQIEMLEALQREREVFDRHRNLIVAATGTGKTVVAALDYKGLRQPLGGNPTLLFVAHRKEILQQALRTYREVLADGSFGELFVDGMRPERWRHVFASVQSLHASGLGHLAASHFDVVVIDESHHIEASSYLRLLDSLAPKELLGLTATPERADGVDVRSHFGGRAAAELRLWDALRADLLVPFHYFGTADETDLSRLTWSRGDYDIASLENLFTGNDARLRIVLKELNDKVLDVRTMRALGFCVSVPHAEWMAQRFNEAGIPSIAVTGSTDRDARAKALRELGEGTLNCILTVDVFNEGLDLPLIDTLLLLRPTQSATIFLQQLGRGLRRTQTKAVLTVLDFIGQQAKEFRFDLRYRALTGVSRGRLAATVEAGFPALPSGSQIILDEVAQRIVVENLRRQIELRRPELVAEVRSYGSHLLRDYLRESGRELEDIYRRGGAWTPVARDAGLIDDPTGPAEPELIKRLHRFVHVDDPDRVDAYLRLLATTTPYAQLGEADQAFARMLFFLVWPNKGALSSYEAGLERLRHNPQVVHELTELLEMGLESAQHTPRRFDGRLADSPLRSHARYSREEILAGIGWAHWERSARGNITGVAYEENSRTDAFLINLAKDERSFSPTTMYRDYAISHDLFHWESQNATSTTSETGRRYLGQRTNGTEVLLFVRPAPTNEIGAAPFLCLGPANYVQHQGNKPIAITWKLRRPMPEDVFLAASVASG